MAALQIPASVHTAFRHLARLEAVAFSGFLSKLQESSGSNVLDSDVIADLVSGVAGVGALEAEQIVAAIAGLLAGRNRDGRPLDALADDAIAGVKRREASVREEPLSEGEFKALEQRIKALLDVRSVTVSSKAFDLMYARERRLLGSRLISDVRPVFGDSATSGPQASLIIHTLCLDVSERSDVREYYIALSEKDLSDLRDAVERAIEKQRALQQMLASAGIEFIKVE